MAKMGGLTFRELIAPIEGERFFAEIYRRRHLHIPGSPEKFAKLFSWDVLNRLLSMTSIWSDHNCELAREGTEVQKESYCYSGTNRDNQRALKPDFRRVRQQLRGGATMALNFIERLTPELRLLTLSLEGLFLAPVNCTCFLSYQGARGYASHFDTTNVIACQIAGTKVWNVYAGRHPGAAHYEGARHGDFAQSHHEKAKGQVLARVEMKPGDLLYLPHGLYHDALAKDEASLHLSFAVRHMVVQDFVKTLTESLPQNAFFREHLPPLDNQRALDEVKRITAQQLGEILGQPQVSDGLRQFLAGKAFENADFFCLPSREDQPAFRVRWLGRRLEQTSTGYRLQGGQKSLEFSGPEAAALASIFVHDILDPTTLEEIMTPLAPPARPEFLERLRRIGLLEPL